MNKWKIEYDNDTGLQDDSFSEWWIVTDGSRVFKCYNKEDTEWLCSELNKQLP